MKKVAFFIDNTSIYDVDASTILQANPGIGGTEYLIMLVSMLLSCRDNGLCIRLYMTREQHNMPKELSCFIVSDIAEAISHAEEEDFDCLVVKHDAEYVQRDCLTTNGNLEIIVWCHVFICYWELNYYANNPHVKYVVHVGREALDLYRDHPVFEKSTYIYNLVNLEGCMKKVGENPFIKRGHVVTYIGSIVPYKGFHLLALAWPQILREVPDAQLYVIGSGQLYNSASELGPLGLASPEYEQVFSSAISQEGKLLDSIHLMGRLGTGKEEILLRTKVGVPNPSGITETFCLSAVELQAYGARIVTIKAPGYVDTVKNGILYKSPKQLADCVVDALMAEEDEYAKAMEYFQNEFSPEIVMKKWENLLLHGSTDSHLPLRNVSYRCKWLKEYCRILKKKVPLFRYLPPVERVLLFLERKIMLKTTYMDSNTIIN